LSSPQTQSMGNNLVGWYIGFHSVMQYGLIFWGNSTHSETIFKQKNILRIITGCRSTDSFRDLFKNWKTLPPQSQYISLLLFVVNNKNKVKFWCL